MSKTYSVREVATALGITPRGVIQRLNRNQLKGTRKVNQFGSPEWQVFATKEITMAIEAMSYNSTESVTATQESFAPDRDDKFEEAIDADSVEIDSSPEGAWLDLERKRLEMLAETLVKPLTEQLASQAAALREKELQLEDKDRQLRLLPDFQKRAEEERKQAEERALEVIALKKQISALETIKDEAKTKVQEADLEMQRLKEEKETEAKALEEENERLKQAVEEASVSAQKLADLEKIVLELQKPKPGFWQKLFGVQQ